jgi:hypothetical protein
MLAHFILKNYSFLKSKKALEAIIINKKVSEAIKKRFLSSKNRKQMKKRRNH